MTIKEQIAGGAVAEYGHAIAEYDAAGRAQAGSWYTEQVANSEFQAYLNRVAPVGALAIQG